MQFKCTGEYAGIDFIALPSLPPPCSVSLSDANEKVLRYFYHNRSTRSVETQREGKPVIKIVPMRRYPKTLRNFLLQEHAIRDLNDLLKSFSY